jgi:hypothetical protein
MSDEFTDEELMAYADGELDEMRAAKLAAVLPQRPDLASRIAVFARTRAVAAESVKAHLDRPVPEKLASSVAAMIADGKSSATVTPLRPKQEAARGPSGNWLMPIAASLLALISGAVGYWVATERMGAAGNYHIAGAADPELVQLLSTLPSGAKASLAHSGAAITMVSSFHRADQALCREFEMSEVDAGNHLAVACHASGKWTVELALHNGGPGDVYKPASPAETLEAFLNALGAGPALGDQAEADALGKLR